MPAGIYEGGDGRSWSSEPYRFGYQGQFAEKDDETGWNAFELRMYDPVIGRFNNLDPYGQFWSPYLGMGNNPNSGVDPDGGLFGKWRAKKWAEKYGGTYDHDPDGNWWAQYNPNESTVVAKNFGYQGLGVSFRDAVYFGTGFTNAVNSNHAFGAGRLDINNEAFIMGQVTGDAFSFVSGIFEMYDGLSMAEGGTLITVSSSGTTSAVSIPIAVAGVGLFIEGASTTYQAAKNLKEAHYRLSKGRSGNYKKLSSNKDANEFARSKGYKDAHDLKAQHDVGSDFDIFIDSKSGEGVLMNKKQTVQIPIY